jgi:hypothetical protein
MPQPNHYTVRVGAELSLETFATEKGAEKEMKQKVKVLLAVAKALGVELWVDEALVEE